MEIDSETDSPSRRNTLPQITLTRCDRQASQHLDLAVSPHQSSSQSSDSITQENIPSISPIKEIKEHSQKPSQEKRSSTDKRMSSEKVSDLHSKTKNHLFSEPSKTQSHKPAGTVRTPEVHSTPSATTFQCESSIRDATPKKTQFKRSPPPFIRRSPSPKRPETLRFATKRGSIPSKKIAGISLAPSKPTRSPPTSPTTDIPSPTKKDPSSPFSKSSPKFTAKLGSKSSPALESPITPEAAKTFAAETSKGKVQEKDQKGQQPPDAPKRQRSHSSSKEKK
ncbi:hypothetical protein CEXT_794951 [Caerostris extrusa]|uniref:Uncharacterized protein n=1 Tax=Caerostris extrusa TaxID=172846 RepID=A0AAV4Q5Y7_CAEEX|nr:hypothetical protein CEXT_794951 [Caerostris extrusa]